MNVRLIREVVSPGGNGPQNGMYALQRALREAAPDWLKIGGDLQPGEIPWFWCWADAWAACECAAGGRPFVHGPNIFFHSAAQPGLQPYERVLLDAASCRMIFTESEWYGALIAQNQKGPAPIVLWPYPVDDAGFPAAPPQLDGPLIYAKSGPTVRDLARFRAFFPAATLVVYGFYRRARLAAIARRAPYCLYLSVSDRGPLALAEILMTGCPTVGCRTGAPWIDHGRNGFYVGDLSPETLARHARKCAALSRVDIREAALAKFSAPRIVETIVAALDTVRG